MQFPLSFSIHYNSAASFLWLQSCGVTSSSAFWAPVLAMLWPVTGLDEAIFMLLWKRKIFNGAAACKCKISNLQIIKICADFLQIFLHILSERLLLRPGSGEVETRDSFNSFHIHSDSSRQQQTRQRCLTMFGMESIILGEGLLMPFPYGQKSVKYAFMI